MADATSGVGREFLPSYPGWRFGLLQATNSQQELIRTYAKRLHDRLSAASPYIRSWFEGSSQAAPFLDSIGILTQALAAVGGASGTNTSRHLEEWVSDAIDDTITELLGQRREFQRLLQSRRHSGEARHRGALGELANVARSASSEAEVDPQLMHHIEHLASGLLQDEALRQEPLLWLYVGWARMGQGYRGQPVDDPLFQAVLQTATGKGILRLLSQQGLAWSRLETGSYDEAAAMAQRAAELSGDSASRALLALALSAKGQWHEALILAEALGLSDVLVLCDLMCEWARLGLAPPQEEMLYLIDAIEQRSREEIRAVATDWNASIRKVRKVQELAGDRVNVPAPLLDDLQRVTGRAEARGLFEVVASHLMAKSMHRELERVAKSEVERFRRSEIEKVENARAALQAAWQEREDAIKGAFQSKTQHDSESRRALEKTLGTPEDNQKGCYLCAGLGCAGFVLYLLAIALAAAFQWPLTATSPVGLGLLGLAAAPLLLGAGQQIAHAVKRTKVEASLAALRAEAQQAYDASVSEADRLYRKGLPKLRDELAEAESRMALVDQVVSAFSAPTPEP